MSLLLAVPLLDLLGFKIMDFRPRLLILSFVSILTIAIPSFSQAQDKDGDASKAGIKLNQSKIQALCETNPKGFGATLRHPKVIE